MTKEEAIAICKEEIRVHRAYVDGSFFSVQYQKCNHSSEDFGRFLDYVLNLLEEKPYDEIEMREATKEEKESIDNHIESISKPTGTNFYNVYGN